MAPAWAERWRVVAPAGTVRVEVGPRGRIAGRGTTAPRTPLALCASGPFARRRVRRAADRAGITLEREYLALPSARSPAFLVEDRSVAIDYFRARILTPPPGMARWSGLAELAVRGTRFIPRSILSWLAPGRVAIGRQP